MDMLVQILKPVSLNLWQLEVRAIARKSTRASAAGMVSQSVNVNCSFIVYDVLVAPECSVQLPCQKERRWVP